MTVERVDPSLIGIAGGTAEDVRRYVESDFLIRSGLCPNGHGLMTENEYGQECPACNFSTNARAEKGRLT